MAQQVKFYSVNSLPKTPNAGGVYFIDNGELYKGSQRFGLGRVTTAATADALAALTGVARGDINVGFEGAKVYDGEAWQPLGGDIASLQSSWRADISTWTAGLVQSGTGSYITGITQGEDGKVTAQASNFATDVQSAVGNGASTSTSNGVTVSVTTTSGAVTAVEVTAPAAKTWTAVDVGDANSYIYNVTQAANGQVSASAKAFPTLATGTADGTVKLGAGADVKVAGWDTVKTDITNLKAVVSYSGTGESVVTASTGNFTNLNVTDTATFSATTVSATNLTVNGSTIQEIADDRIAAISSVTKTGTSNGITVSVTTAAGSVTAVSVDATAFGNVMSFKGVVTALPSEDNVAGDIVVIGANPTGAELVQGQEYIYSGTAWELIGDQKSYALNAYTSTASVYAGAATLPAAVSKAGAAIDTLNTKVSALESAVTGGTDDDGSAGVNVSVTTAETTAAPTVTVTVTKATLNTTLGTTNVADKTVATTIGATGADTALATEKAVRDAITAAELVWLDASGAVIA